MIRNAENKDISEIIRIHQSSLPEDLLPSLGVKVMEDYFNLFIDDNIIFVSENEGLINGFIAIAFNEIEYKNILIKNLLHVLNCFINKPSKFFECISLLMIKNNSITIFPEISFIAIEPTMRKMKIGSNLLLHTINFLHERNIKKIIVKTETKNKKTNSFYAKNKFRIIDYENRFRRKFYVYERLI